MASRFDEFEQCPMVFELKGNGRKPICGSQCVLAKDHRPPHKSPKPGGMVLWIR